MSFQVHINTVLQRSSLKRGHPARSMQKFRALTEMLAPQNKKELQAFLGMINYLSKFSPDMSEVCKTTEKADIKQSYVDMGRIIPTMV